MDRQDKTAMKDQCQLRGKKGSFNRIAMTDEYQLQGNNLLRRIIQQNSYEGSVSATLKQFENFKQ